ncbi:MAG: imidazole glycerol phosphate synthase cyclase subunit [Bifidobacterium mongoliense]|nr:imidazole glycerol phosphate synthase cyclase subunit [Bifidobacterium mongoliense]
MSLAVRVIPCLDVDAGRVVKGVHFEHLRDAGDPVELAAEYYRQGADELTFLDVTASSSGRATMLDVVTRTAAIADPALISRIADRFGNQVLVLSVDARRERGERHTVSGFEVTTMGGRHATGIDALWWAKRAQDLGAGEILLNSMDADGTEQGFDLEMIAAMRRRVDIPIIASGGAGRVEDFPPAIKAGANAVLAASVFHFGKVSIAEVKGALQDAGYEVR